MYWCTTEFSIHLSRSSYIARNGISKSYIEKEKLQVRKEEKQKESRTGKVASSSTFMSIFSFNINDRPFYIFLK